MLIISQNKEKVMRFGISFDASLSGKASVVRQS